jgi:F420-non-reducing hydrogenase large subunit
MAFRAYDPCLGCATHSLTGQRSIVLRIREKNGEVIKEIRR